MLYGMGMYIGVDFDLLVVIGVWFVVQLYKEIVSWVICVCMVV